MVTVGPGKHFVTERHLVAEVTPDRPMLHSVVISANLRARNRRSLSVVARLSASV